MCRIPTAKHFKVGVKLNRIKAPFPVRPCTEHRKTPGSHEPGVFVLPHGRKIPAAGRKRDPRFVRTGGLLYSAQGRTASREGGGRLIPGPPVFIRLSQFSYQASDLLRLEIHGIGRLHRRVSQRNQLGMPIHILMFSPTSVMKE